MASEISNIAIAATGAIAAAFAPQASQAQEPVQPEATIERAESRDATADRFMIAAANPIAAEIGREVLAEGGSAADAAIAAQFALNLVEPQSSGIGGGAFLLYWDASEGELITLDGRETAPAAAGPDYFLLPNGEPMDWWDAVVGGRSVGTPGTLKLLEAAHERWGTREWADLIEPTRALALEGFAISPRLAGAIARAKERSLDRFEPTRSYFFHEDGSPKREGEILANPAFAESLALIQEDGASALYEGPIGEAIVDAVRATEENPSLLTLEDLADYEVVERAPVCVDYRGYEVCGMGPPTSGGLTIGQILGVLEHFDMPGLGHGPEAAHLFLEAAKLAYADRGLYMADSDFTPMPTAGLIDPFYLTLRAQYVDPASAMEKAQPGNPPWRDAMLLAPDTQEERPGTSHFVIVDRMGDAVSMTTTIETGFGSRVMAGGFLLNNELTDFSRAPERDGRLIANRVEGGKRPRSSMSPTIVLKDGEPYFLIGSPGGSRIINYVAKTLVAVLDWRMGVQEAIDLGHFVNRNGATDLERGTDAEKLEAALIAKGHETTLRDLNSGLHGILIHADGTLEGGADPRREGVALGE